MANNCENKSQTNNKRVEFGNRYLTEGNDVFEHNAWYSQFNTLFVYINWKFNLKFNLIVNKGWHRMGPNARTINSIEN